MKIINELFRDKKSMKLIYILMAVGVALLLAGQVFSTSQEEEAPSEAKAEFDVAKLEQRLSETLSLIKGAGKVKVMVTMEDSGNTYLARDTDQERESTVVLSQSGGEKVTAVRETTPHVRGAIAIAEGAHSAALREMLQGALCALLDLDAHKIKVYEGVVNNDAGI